MKPSLLISYKTCSLTLSDAATGGFPFSVGFWAVEERRRISDVHSKAKGKCYL